MPVIPGKIISFLERANVAICGTRDKELVPHAHRVSGWRVGPERDTLECFVPQDFTERLVESLQDNRRIAVTIEEFPSHETYQFKGSYLAHRPALAADEAAYEQCRERFVRGVRNVLNMPDETIRAFVRRPRVVVAFKVEEIYLQTPGPGAGTRLVPPLELP